MKPNQLRVGDHVAIVSLSSGVLGEKFVAHELELGIKRLEEMGLVPVFMPNSQKGIDYLSKNPKARAEDLVAAFENKHIKGIICAIGGNDAYKVIPFILDDKKAVETIKNNPKFFMGFSDSTIDHLLLNKLGLNTFYGPAFLTDFAELDTEMLPYTKFWFLNLLLNLNHTKLTPSDVWYKERTDFSMSALGTPRQMQFEERKYMCLCGKGEEEGELFGGCLDVIYSIFDKEDKEKQKVFAKYDILPKTNKDKILFLETSDSKPTPAVFEKMLKTLKENKFFDGVKGVLFGKPQDEKYFDDYAKIIKQELAEYNVLYNVNFGHALPRCIMPYNIKTKVNFDNKTIEFVEKMFE